MLLGISYIYLYLMLLATHEGVLVFGGVSSGYKPQNMYLGTTAVRCVHRAVAVRAADTEGMAAPCVSTVFPRRAVTVCEQSCEQ